MSIDPQEVPPFGIPVAALAETREPVELFAARGWSGLKRWGGRIDDTFLNELKGTAGIRVFREMRDTEPVVGAGLLTTSMMMRAVPWGVEPASDSAEDKAEAEYIEECMYDMEHGWDDLIDEAISFLVFGWALHEIVYKIRKGPDNPDRKFRSRYNDGRLGWRSVRLRGQESLDRWQWDEDDALHGMHQVTEYAGYAYIPLSKAVLFRTSKHKDNPEGRSILTNAYRPWKFKRELEIVEGIGAERDLVGVPHMMVPAEILAADATGQVGEMRAYLEQVLGDLRQDERSYVLMPNEESGYKLELLRAGGTRQIDLNPIMERKSREIAFAMLMDFILLGHERVGTQALAGTKTDIYKTAIQGWVEAIEDAINTQLIPALYRAQGDLRPELPQVKGGRVSSIDIQGKIDVFEKLARIGSFNNQQPPLKLINTILRDSDLPEVEEGDIKEPPPPPDPFGGFGGFGLKPPTAGAPPRKAPPTEKPRDTP